MANVLSAEKRQQVIALGRLGWSLRRIEEATGVRREAASFSLLMRVGMQGSLIMALPLDWNFVKQRGAPGRPQYGRTGEDCHPPRLAAPGSCHTRNSVPVMRGRLFEVQRPSPLPRYSAR